MKAIRTMGAILSLLEDPGAIKALATWPKFSKTSYFVVSELIRQGVSPGTVIDVGAHVGQFAVASAKLFPNVQVHSFEPVPDLTERLRRNVSGLGNVVVYPLALGEEEGVLSFHVNTYSQLSSALPLTQAYREAFPTAMEERSIKVKATTLDRIVSNIELRKPVLLKLDVQGSEAATLRGGMESLKRVDYVVLETSFKPLYEGELLFMEIARMMEEQGFHFDRPVGWPRLGVDEFLQMDALFVRDARTN